MLIVKDDKDSKKPVEYAQELLALVETQIEIYEKIGRFSEYLNQEKQQINEFFKKTSKKIIELYKSSFNLIEIYGEFYVITERIWVTCDNIFR